MQENKNGIVHRKMETDINPIELLRQLLSHIGLILLIAFLCMAITGLYTFYYVTPIYESTSKLYILNSGDSAINLSDLQVGSYLANDYIEVFNTWEVHQMVIKNLDLPYTTDYMQSMLTVTNPSNTRILSITVKSPNPHEAMEIANEYAAVAIQFISKTMSTEEPNIMSEALEPVSPTLPKKTFNLILGFILGLFLSASVIVLRYMIEDRIKTADDIRKYSDLSVLAVVPTLKQSQSHKKSTKQEK